MPIPFGGLQYAPVGIVVLNDGTVFYTAQTVGGTGLPALHKRDASGNFSDFTAVPNGTKVDRMAVSPDGSRVYLNVSNGIFWLDTSNDQLHAATSNYASSDMTLSADGSTAYGAGYFMDASLAPENAPGYLDWETWFPSTTNGAKLNSDGSILFQPLTDGIDLITRDAGRMRYRIQVAGGISGVYDPMIMAESGGVHNEVAVIQPNGVSFVDLSGLSIPASDQQPFPQ